jgi:DNA polymerase-4
VRVAPFFTTHRIRKLPQPTFDPDMIAATALDLLAGLQDDRPIRLLGVRAEMVPPVDGYHDPRTTGRGGPSARASGTGGASETDVPRAGS